jgi:glycolate oxidase iron-sulfur subunit
MFAQRGLSPLARVVLGIFRQPRLWRPVFTAAKAFRATRLPALFAGRNRLRFGLGMLAASTEIRERHEWVARPGDAAVGKQEGETRKLLSPLGQTVALFRGCVMDTLFGHVHEATLRTLEINGYRVLDLPGQGCCGALHEHAGDRNAARELASRNLEALEGKADFLVVNSAGCGAIMKDYGHLLGSERAARFATTVRDISELLAERGPRPGATLDLDVAYDPPCHLQHAQRIHEAPLAVLRAIPGLRLRLLPGADRCCGSAGIYSLLRPGMARAVLQQKIAGLRTASPRPAVVLTGNPGCLMQLGAGLRAANLPIGVAHPVELLDLSYSEAGFYEGPRRTG